MLANTVAVSGPVIQPVVNWPSALTVEFVVKQNLYSTDAAPSGLINPLITASHVATEDVCWTLIGARVFTSGAPTTNERTFP